MTAALTPIPVFAVPAKVVPELWYPIVLYWDKNEGINWNKGQRVTKAELEQAIERSRGQHLPNRLLPALDPGDVLILKDAVVWIDRNWKLQPVKVSE